MIAGQLRLLVGGIVFFVDDDQCQVGNGREDSGARADHYVRLAATDAVPLCGAFCAGQCGVQQRHLIAEGKSQLCQHGRRQANFRN